MHVLGEHKITKLPITDISSELAACHSLNTTEVRRFIMKPRFALILFATLCMASSPSIGAQIFDNGPVNANRTTWNATGPFWNLRDDYSLTSTTTITSIEYNIFQNDSSKYSHTLVTIFDGAGGVPGAIVVATFSAIASPIISNGLTTTNSNVTNGFTHTISGLSISLPAGNYFLNVSIFSTSGQLTSIGSGPGSLQTIGAGLLQNGYLRTGDHMAFKVFGVVDNDGDGVLDDDDYCPATPDTANPEGVPTVQLRPNHWALIDGDSEFDTVINGKGKGPNRSYLIEDTAGCSCEQIIEMQGLGNGHTYHGCSISAMDDWVELVN